MSVDSTRQWRLFAAWIMAVCVGGWSPTADAARWQETEQAPPVTSAQDDTTKPEEKIPPPVRAYKRLLQSTLYLEFLKDEPEGRMRYRGTGWVIDRERRLVITNQHVVADQAELTAWCPVYKDGDVIGQYDYYFNQVPGIRATVIDRDSRRDLALVQLDRLPDDMVALPLAAKSPTPGEKVFSLGAWPFGSEGWWIFTAGEVRSVYDRSHALGYVCRIVETQLPTNQGNSGGPVINDRGELVAVVEGHSTEARLVSLFIAVEEVRKYMEELAPLVDPQTAEAFYTRGDRNYYAGQFRQAAADYTSCLKLDAKHVGAMNSRGWANYQLDDYQTALVDFDQALATDPDFVDSHIGRGRCFSALEQYDKARDAFTEAIRRAPGQEAYHYWRGDANYWLGEYQQALADLNEAVKLSPDDLENRLLRAKIHRRMENWDAAMEDGRAAVELASDDYRGYQECALVLRNTSEYERAVVVYGGAIELAPDKWDLYLGRGNCYHEMGRHEEAINDFVKSIELNGNNPYSYWGLGLIMRDAEEWARAITFFSKCIELDPNDPDYYEQRARCYDAIGETDNAAADRGKLARLRGGN